MQRQLCDPCRRSILLGRTADRRICVDAKRTVRDAHSAKSNHRCQAASAVQTATESPETEFKIAAEEMPAPRGGCLKEEATAYVEEHRIRAYEADPNQRTTIVTMSNLLQARPTALWQCKHFPYSSSLQIHRQEAFSTCYNIKTSVTINQSSQGQAGVVPL